MGEADPLAHTLEHSCGIENAERKALADKLFWHVLVVLLKDGNFSWIYELERVEWCCSMLCEHIAKILYIALHAELQEIGA